MTLKSTTPYKRIFRRHFIGPFDMDEKYKLKNRFQNDGYNMIAYDANKKRLNSLNKLRMEFRTVARSSNRQRQRFLPERDKQWPKKRQMAKKSSKRKRSIETDLLSQKIQVKPKKDTTAKKQKQQQQQQKQQNENLYRNHPYNNEEVRKKSEIAMVVEMIENNLGDLETFSNMVTQFTNADDNRYANVDYTKLIEVQESKKAKGVENDSCNNNETNKYSTSNHASRKDTSSTSNAAKTIKNDTIYNKSVPAYIVYTYNHDAPNNASDKFTSREEEYLPTVNKGISTSTKAHRIKKFPIISPL